MRCPDCKAQIPDVSTSCPECHLPLVRGTSTPAALYYKHKLESEVFTAGFEQRKYHLTPQLPGETAEQFVKRIDREKTPLVVAENNRCAANLEAHGFHSGGNIKAHYGPRHG